MSKDPLIRIMLGIAGAALMIMVIVVIADILCRAVVNMPVRGAYDVISICLLVMTAFGIGPVIAQRAEIVIDLIDEIVPPVFVRGLGVVSSMLGLAIFAYIGWAMLTPAKDAWTYGDRSLELGLPLWILWSVAVLGIACAFWGYLMQVRSQLRTPIKRDVTSEEGAL